MAFDYTKLEGYLLVRKSPDSVEQHQSHRIGGLLLGVVVL